MLIELKKCGYPCQLVELTECYQRFVETYLKLKEEVEQNARNSKVSS